MTPSKSYASALAGFCCSSSWILLLASGTRFSRSSSFASVKSNDEDRADCFGTFRFAVACCSACAVKQKRISENATNTHSGPLGRPLCNVVSKGIFLNPADPLISAENLIYHLQRFLGHLVLWLPSQ